MTRTASFRGVADAFLETARRLGPAPAVVRGGEETSFAQLAEDVERLAGGLRRAGLEPGDRAALLVPPSRDLYALVFAMYRAGVVPVLVDPGLGLPAVGRCLAETEPKAFIGTPKAHLGRFLGKWAPTATVSVVADGKLPGMWDTRELRRMGAAGAGREARPEELAAVLFTSGSTGPAKGVLYTHGMFAAQVEALRALFDIKEGEVSIPTFPLFGLFDAALGLTSVIPRMDFTKPARVDPMELVRLAQGRRAQQLFGSPALLDRLGRFGERFGIALPDLRRVMSAGAPVPAKVVIRVRKMLAPGVEVYTPYGATEALPVALIGSEEILHGADAACADGKGTCVGRPVPGVDACVIPVSDGPVAAWDESLRLPAGAVGEVTVKGPMVSAAYWRRPEADAAAKIADGGGARHRMGDLGRFDADGRLWFLGRKSQRVRASHGDMPTEGVEGVFNALPAVRRSALVGVGPAGAQTPVLCVEREPGQPIAEDALRRQLLELAQRREVTRPVRVVLFHPGFPVDARHNAKIHRETLAAWAASELRR
ncbi:MAG: fatty acid CoA ligase family protein [Elusimicrobiota bacterium]|nr:fatty acid CoA ligase family protein [Elusimicrobiota bacterium]